MTLDEYIVSLVQLKDTVPGNTPVYSYDDDWSRYHPKTAPNILSLYETHLNIFGHEYDDDRFVAAYPLEPILPTDGAPFVAVIA